MPRICISLLFLLVTGIQSVSSQTTLRVMTYNLRYGELADMKTIAGVIRLVDPDLVALQEVDINIKRLSKTKARNTQFISLLGQYTGMFSAFGRAIYERNYYIGKRGDYGNGILSKYSFDRTQTHAYQAKGTETRIALESIITLPSGEQIRFISTHLDHKNDSVRRLQVKQINDLFANGDMPTILAGDFNERPNDKNGCIATLDEHWARACNPNELTFIAWNPYVKIDYIFYYPKNRWKVLESKVIEETKASDHRPLTAVLELLDNH